MHTNSFLRTHLKCFRMRATLGLGSAPNLVLCYFFLWFIYAFNLLHLGVKKLEFALPKRPKRSQFEIVI